MAIHIQAKINTLLLLRTAMKNLKLRMCPVVEFLNVIGTKVLGIFLLVFSATSTNGFYSPTPLSIEQNWFETGL
jgi:hypothetical protein